MGANTMLPHFQAGSQSEVSTIIITYSIKLTGEFSSSFYAFVHTTKAPFLLLSFFASIHVTAIIIIDKHY